MMRIGKLVVLGFVSATTFIATALPAVASPTTYLVEDESIRVECVRGAGPEIDIYTGTGNGSYTDHDPTEESRFTNQTTFHIVWEFVNEADDSDTFTYIDTGIAQTRFEGETAFVSVSGHTTARPGDGALSYGRWLRIDDPIGIPINWINRDHATGCTLIVP
jgi:hypothetical protein